MNTGAANEVRVFLNPDGTGDDFVGVVVRRTTGVWYGVQCAGVAAEVRWVEGYLVPVSGSLYNPAEGRISVSRLRSIFHVGEHCVHASGARTENFEAALRTAICAIPFWSVTANGEDTRCRLQLDRARLAEVVEGCVPVVTPVGPAVLLWTNCD